MLGYLKKKTGSKDHDDKKKRHSSHHHDDRHDHHREHRHDDDHDRRHSHHRREEEEVDKTHRFDSPVLSSKDEQFLQHILLADDGSGTPIKVDPLDLAEAGEAHGNDMQLVVSNKQPIDPNPDDEPGPLAIEDAPGDWDVEDRHRDRERDRHRDRAGDDDGGPKKLRKEDKRPSESSNRWSFMQRFGSKKVGALDDSCVWAGWLMQCIHRARIIMVTIATAHVVTSTREMSRPERVRQAHPHLSKIRY